MFIANAGIRETERHCFARSLPFISLLVGQSSEFTIALIHLIVIVICNLSLHSLVSLYERIPVQRNAKWLMIAITIAIRQ